MLLVRYSEIIIIFAEKNMLKAKSLKSVISRVGRSKVLKYVVVVVAAVVIVGFVDETSVWSHFRNKQKIGELESEIERYKAIYEHDKAQLRKLDSDPKAIEKIARERYFMKADDEDIFVLSDDNPATQLPVNETTE